MEPWVVIAFWVVGLVAVAVSIERVKRPETEGPCVDCGYSLVGLADSGICPECGAAYVKCLYVASAWTIRVHWLRISWAVALVVLSSMVAAIPAAAWYALLIGHGYRPQFAIKASVGLGGLEVGLSRLLWSFAASGIGLYLCCAWAVHRRGVRAAARIARDAYGLMLVWFTAAVASHWWADGIYWIFNEGQLEQRMLSANCMGMVCCAVSALLQELLADIRRASASV